NSVVIIIFLLSSSVLSAQTNRYVVHLKDKNGTSYSVSNPEQFLSQRSIQRRTNQKIAIVDEDLPISANYRAQLKASGANVFYSSKWLNCVLVETTPAIISTVQLLPFVVRTELVAPGKKLSSGRVGNYKKRKAFSSELATNSQLSMIGIDSMHRDGFKGEGISLAVFDSGFEGVNTALPFEHIFNEGRLSYTFDFIANTKNVFQYDDHGTEVFSVIAAYSPGIFSGGAYGASYTLFVTEDVGSEYRIEEYNWLFAAEKADSTGVDVINASLGYNLFDDATMNYNKETDLDGNTAIVSFAAKKSLEKGMMVVSSAGNEGSNSWKFVTPPADVDGVLAIGSITATKVKSSFSSIGPTSDGRIKPDVVALGSSTSVITSTGSPGKVSGTSVAAPLITSLVAGVWQRYPQLTTGELYNAIINSADQAQNPDQLKGYGIPNYNSVKNYLEAVLIDEDIVIYPNPTNDSIRVAFKKAEGQSVVISIYNLQGKVFSEYTVAVTWQNNPVIVNLSSFSPGLYFIKVKANDSVKIVRIAKL
ncbi:MAG: S8 family peptidase, partial [Bacteroidia bacterium]|nr:S8 family peptidase [Bacteroidia bacterium]